MRLALVDDDRLDDDSLDVVSVGNGRSGEDKFTAWPEPQDACCELNGFGVETSNMAWTPFKLTSWHC